MKRSLLVLCLWVVLPVLAWSQDRPGGDKAEAKQQRAGAQFTQQELEKKLAERLSGSIMTGHFTVTGMQQESLSPKAEKYTLKEVRKLEGDNWLFNVRIQYGDHDKTLPITLPILWAGDTPIITVSNVYFPGFGTFNARVLIYQDQYAGTWSGAGHGGQLFGKIIPGAAKDAEQAGQPEAK